MSPRDDALRRFNELNQNCAQAVLAAHGPELGLDEASCLRVAACFGAGIGRQGHTCGALTGAYMVLGLRYGHEMSEGLAGRGRVYGRVQALTKRFEERFGSASCAALTACDLSTPEGREDFARRGLHEGLCAKLVVGAVELLEEQ